MENSINKALTEEDKVTAVILAIQGHSVDNNQMLTDFHDRELFLSMLNVDAILDNKFGIAIDVESIAMSIRGLSMTKWYNTANDCKLAFRRKCVVTKVYDCR